MSPKTGWHVHFQGETLGPLSAEKILAMLSQNRLQFTDFAWKRGMMKWVRMSDIDEFASHMPAYPKVSLPEDDGKGVEAEAKVSEKRPAPQTQSEETDEEEVKIVSKEKTAPAKPAVSRRRFLRVPFDGEIATKSHGKFTILNAAERGVFVGAEKALDVGTELKFILTTKAFSKPLEMTGVVVRHSRDEEDPGFAIEFTRINPAHKRLFEDYIRAWAEK